MATLHRALADVFGVLLDPVAGLKPVVGLTLISVVSGVLLLFAFRIASNPRAIRTARYQAQAQLLAVRLYRDDLGVVMRAQLSLLGALAVYMGYMVVPFLVLLVPFGLLFAHLDARYATRALHPGERALVKVIAHDGSLDHWRLEGAGGVVVDSAPVRIPERGEIDWRIRAVRPGSYEMALTNGAERVVKSIHVTTAERGAAPQRSVPGIAALFLAPIEAPIDPRAGVESIDVAYPPLHLTAFGWNVHWIVVFLVVSAAAALVFRKRAGVEF